MDARNPSHYERGIIIAEVLITFLSIPFLITQARLEQASVEWTGLILTADNWPRPEVSRHYGAGATNLIGGS
jgi:hypothetical protein